MRSHTTRGLEHIFERGPSGHDHRQRAELRHRRGRNATRTTRRRPAYHDRAAPTAHTTRRQERREPEVHAARARRGRAQHVRQVVERGGDQRRGLTGRRRTTVRRRRRPERRRRRAGRRDLPGTHDGDSNEERGKGDTTATAQAKERRTTTRGTRHTFAQATNSPTDTHHNCGKTTTTRRRPTVLRPTRGPAADTQGFATTTRRRSDGRRTSTPFTATHHPNALHHRPHTSHTLDRAGKRLGALTTMGVTSRPGVGPGQHTTHTTDTTRDTPRSLKTTTPQHNSAPNRDTSRQRQRHTWEGFIFGTRVRRTLDYIATDRRPQHRVGRAHLHRVLDIPSDRTRIGITMLFNAPPPP